MLNGDSGLKERPLEDLATSLNQIADKARDLDEIMTRLLDEKHSPAEIGDLLIAFELTLEQIRGHSDVVDGKLYEIGERLKGDSSSETPSEGVPAPEIATRGLS